MAIDTVLAAPPLTLFRAQRRGWPVRTLVASVRTRLRKNPEILVVVGTQLVIYSAMLIVALLLVRNGEPWPPSLDSLPG